MKTLLVSLLLVLAVTAPTHAENSFDLFADQSMTSCTLADDGQLPKAIYVFLRGSEPASNVVFSAPVPACWTGATWAADGFPGARGTIGNSQIGITATLFVPGEFECRTPPVLVCTMYFIATGASQPCCDYRVVPKQLSGWIYPLNYTDCNYIEHPAVVGQKVVINSNQSCPCQLPVATESTTWGRVKSLYH